METSMDIFKYSLLITSMIHCAVIAQTENLNPTVRIENAGWQKLKEYLIKVTYITLHQTDAFTNLAHFLKQTGPLLPLQDVNPISQWMSSNQQSHIPPPLGIALHELIVNLDDMHYSNSTFSRTRHEGARNDLKLKLQQLQALLNNPNQDRSNFRRQCGIRMLNDWTDVPDAFNLVVESANSRTLHELLAKNFDRRIFLRWAKSLIGDIIAYQIIACGACAVDCGEIESEFPNRNISKLIDFLLEAEHELINTWMKQDRIKKDVIRIISNLPARRVNENNVKIALEAKYYWYNFRIHNYTGDNIDLSMMLVGPNSTRYVHRYVWGYYALVIHWIGNAMDSDVAESFQTLSSDTTPSNIQTSTTRATTLTTQSPIHLADRTSRTVTPGILEADSHRFGIAGASLDAAVSPPSYLINSYINKQKQIIEKTGQVVNSGLKPVKMFRTLFKFISGFAQFLGPIASGICSLMSLFEETGTADVFNKIQETINDVHTRFDALDIKLNRMKAEIIDAADRNDEFRVLEGFYIVNINHKLTDFLRTKSEHKTNKHNAAADAYLNSYKTACFPHEGELYPKTLLGAFSNYFLSQDPNNLLTRFASWAKRQHAKTVQGYILSYARDALAIGFAVTTDCLEFSNSEYNNPVYRAKEAAKAVQTVGQVLNRLYSAYDSYLHGWQSGVAGEVHATMAEVMASKPQKSNVRGLILERVESVLNEKFKGNNWHIYVFSNRSYDEDINRHMPTDRKEYPPVFRWIANPDYALMTSYTDKWHFIINWNLESETPEAEKIAVRQRLLQNGETCAKPKYDQRKNKQMEEAMFRVLAHKEEDVTIRSAFVSIDWAKEELRWKKPYCDGFGQFMITRCLMTAEECEKQRQDYIEDACWTRNNGPDERTWVHWENMDCCADTTIKKNGIFYKINPCKSADHYWPAAWCPYFQRDYGPSDCKTRVVRSHVFEAYVINYSDGY